MSKHSPSVFEMATFGGNSLHVLLPRQAFPWILCYPIRNGFEIFEIFKKINKTDTKWKQTMTHAVQKHRDPVWVLDTNWLHCMRFKCKTKTTTTHFQSAKQNKILFIQTVWFKLLIRIRIRIRISITKSASVEKRKNNLLLGMHMKIINLLL